MLERFVDSLNISADRAKMFMDTPEKTKPSLFVDFIEGLKTSAGSAHQLAHSRMDTRWLDIRDLLEKILDLGKQMPPTKGDDSKMWLRINKTLLEITDNGKKLGALKAQTRIDTLSQLSYREVKARTESQSQ